ncbi:MAG: hypothetical protein AAGK78_15805 [Planctomycetota bacterium]
MTKSHDTDVQKPSSTLTSVQRRFLEAVRDLPEPLVETARRTKVSMATVAQWLAEPAFFAALKHEIRTARRRREATLQLGSVDAADRLASAVLGEELSTPQHRACVDVIKLARTTPTRNAKSTAKQREVPVVHGDVDVDEVAELRVRLEED